MLGFTVVEKIDSELNFVSLAECYSHIRLSLSYRREAISPPVSLDGIYTVLEGTIAGVDVGPVIEALNATGNVTY